jgi:hypothetical protein
VRIISNRGTNRAIDQIKSVTATADASAISSSVSIFGLSALQDALMSIRAQICPPFRFES